MSEAWKSACAGLLMAGAAAGTALAAGPWTGVPFAAAALALWAAAARLAWPAVSGWHRARTAWTGEDREWLEGAGAVLPGGRR